MKNITLHIEEIDYLNHKIFACQGSCLLATAAKRQLGAIEVTELVDRIKIDGRFYGHREFDWREYKECVSENRMFSITLIPY